MDWDGQSCLGLRLGEHHVSGEKDWRTNSAGIAVRAYLVVLRVCHHASVLGKPWYLFQLKHAWCLPVMMTQGEYTVEGTMGKT